MVRIRNIVEQIRSSYWFVPTLMALASIALSFVTISIDQQVQRDWVRQVGFLWSGGADGARSLLSTVAGSMITVAGVVLSITLVVLSLASSQFGPRLLRNFMSDAASQLVLGSFIATYLYSLLILRTIRSGNSNDFVPYISVTLTLVLTVASLAVLIAFIHHTALAIQAPNVIAGVAGELLAATDELFPTGAGEEQEASATLPGGFSETARAVRAPRSGYIEAIDERALLRVASERDLVLELLFRPGHFVIEGEPVLCAWPGESVDDRLAGKLGRRVLIGKQRSPLQDVEFAIEQLVEVAVRALSPGVNEPFTALTCIDWLGAALCRLAAKPFPASHRYDEAGHLRLVVANPLTFPGVVNAAFDQIREYAAASVAVRMRLLKVIAQVLNETACEENRAALLRQADMIERGSERAIPEHSDQAEVGERFRQTYDAGKPTGE